MKKLEGLVFDLDGTLIDNAPDIRHALNHMLSLHGRPPLSLETVRRGSGDGLLTQMQRALKESGGYDASAEMAYFKEFITCYRTLAPDPLQIYPHVVDILTRYRKAGVPLGLCTNKQAEPTQRLLRALDLERFFDFVAGGDTYEVHKPHPDHLYNVITALDVSAEGVVMVGDSRNDVAVAKACHVPCVVITQGYGEAYDQMGADLLIPDMGALPQALEQLGYAA